MDLTFKVCKYLTHLSAPLHNNLHCDYTVHMVLFCFMLWLCKQMPKTRAGTGHPQLHPNVSLIIPSIPVISWGWGMQMTTMKGWYSPLFEQGLRDEPGEDSETIRRTTVVLGAVSTKKWEKRGESRIRTGKWFRVQCIVYVGGVEQKQQDYRKHWLAWRDNKNSADTVQLMCVCLSARSRKVGVVMKSFPEQC